MTPPPHPHRRTARMNPTAWFCLSASVLAFAASGALAQSAADAEKTKPTQLDAITVSGDRGETTVGKTTAPVSVIDETAIEQRGIHRLQDLPRYEPGVTVSNSPQRAGAGGYTIRGISNNRILMQVDGTRLPEAPESAAGAASAGYTRDMVDFETLKQVEILRGPASALHGSDALGGAVTYVTKDPRDYLTGSRDWFGSIKEAYDSADNSFAETATAALRAGEFSLLGIFTRRDGEEYRSKDRSARNPQDYDGNNGFAKLVWDHGDDVVKVTGEYFQRGVDTTLKNDVGNSASYIFSMAPPRITRGTYQSSVADDDTSRWRIGIEHEHKAEIGFIDALNWRLYATGFDRTEERTRTTGVTTSTNPSFAAGSTILEAGKNESHQTIFGGALNLRSKADIGGIANTFDYGVSLDYIRTERLRDVTLNNTRTGATAKSYGGDTYPSRTFPNTNTVMAAAFLQDEISLGSLRLIPALRLDYYNMDPDVDDAYLRSSTRTIPSGLNKVSLSPKFGATYDLTKSVSLFGQYAHGFRAPPYDDANLGFSNPTYGYEVLPNADLQPETSDGVELGVRSKFAGGSSVQFSSFYNRYKNFINQKQVGTSGGLIQYQAQNLAKVEIFGFEGKGEWRFHPNWSLTGAFAFARGFDLEDNTPIDEVAPFTINTALSYTAPDNFWGAQIATVGVLPKTKFSTTTNMKVPAYATVDLSAYVNPTEHVSIGASVKNLLNQGYYNYTNVIGVAANDSDRHRYLEAGRTFLIQATYQF